jgi:fatty-acid desaturase
LKKAAKKAALEEKNKETAQRIRKQLKLMIIIKALGSLLAQIGLLQAGANTLISMLIMPALIIVAGIFIINHKINDDLALRLSKYLIFFYCFLILAVVGNIMSFLVNIGFINTIKV